MRNYVKSYIKSCVGCAFYTTPGGRQEGQYHLGPFSKSSKRNEHVLVIVYAFTKFTIARAVRSTATKHVLDVLHDVTSYLGMLDRIVTDRGTAITSKDFEKYCKSNNVKHILNAVRTPRANGHAERTNRIILSMMLPSNDIDKRWDDNIRSIQWSINTMVNSTTKCFPFQLLYEYEPRDILKNAITNIIQSQDQKMLTDAQMLRQLSTITGLLSRSATMPNMRSQLFTALETLCWSRMSHSARAHHANWSRATKDIL